MSNVIALSHKTAPQMFTVDSLPISSPHGTIHGKKGLFVGDRCINIVSDKYEVHQPAEILQTFKDVANRTNLEIVRTLSNRTNGGLMISAKFSECKILKEKHDINLTFYTSHCGKYKTFLTLDLLRIACMNQVPVLYANKARHIFAEKHYQNALDVKLIGSILDGIVPSVEAYQEKAEKLADKRFNVEKFVEFYAEHYKLKTTQKQFDSKVEKAKMIYKFATGQETLKDSAYKALNAITFFNTHEGKQTAMKQERILIQNSTDTLSAMDELLKAA